MEGKVRIYQIAHWRCTSRGLFWQLLSKLWQDVWHLLRKLVGSGSDFPGSQHLESWMSISNSIIATAYILDVKIKLNWAAQNRLRITSSTFLQREPAFARLANLWNFRTEKIPHYEKNLSKYSASNQNGYYLQRSMIDTRQCSHAGHIYRYQRLAKKHRSTTGAKASKKFQSISSRLVGAEEGGTSELREEVDSPTNV